MAQFSGQHVASVLIAQTERPRLHRLFALLLDLLLAFLPVLLLAA